MEAREIAEKYVYGRHDALTDAQEVKDMVADIECFRNNKYEAQGWKIYTPDDDESVVVMEDAFGTKRSFDVDDFVKLMGAINGIREY